MYKQRKVLKLFMTFGVIRDMERTGLLIGFLFVISLISFAQSGRDSLRSSKNTEIFINGKPVHDTLHLSNFEKTDYIKGRQAIELFGLKGKGGVYLVSSDGKIPVYGVVSLANGNKINNAEVISMDGKVLMKTNKCGVFFISSFKLYEELIIRKKGYKDTIFRVQQTENLVKLAKAGKK